MPVSIYAATASERSTPSRYPAPFAAMMDGRSKWPHGAPFGITSFDVNHVTLATGAISARMHVHAVQDEWIHLLEGELTLVHDRGDTVLGAGALS